MAEASSGNKDELAKECAPLFETVYCRQTHGICCWPYRHFGNSLVLLYFVFGNVSSNAGLPRLYVMHVTHLFRFGSPSLLSASVCSMGCCFVCYFLISFLASFASTSSWGKCERRQSQQNVFFVYTMRTTVWTSAMKCLSQWDSQPIIVSLYYFWLRAICYWSEEVGWRSCALELANSAKISWGHFASG